MNEQNEQLLNAIQVAYLVGASVQTITTWYSWKKLHPEHELAALLPDYQHIGNRKARYWNKDDVWKLMKFRESLPQGRYGILGEVTQKYVKKKEKN